MAAGDEGQSVSDRQHHAGAGGGGKPEPARLGDRSGGEQGVGLAAEGAGLAGGNGHDGDPLPTDMGQHPTELFGLTTVGKGQQDIARTEDPQVAMHRLGGMQEQGAGAGGREGGGKLATDEPGFSHPCDDHRPGAVEQQPHSVAEAVIKPTCDILQRLRGQLQDLAGFAQLLEAFGGNNTRGRHVARCGIGRRRARG